MHQSLRRGEPIRVEFTWREDDGTAVTGGTVEARIRDVETGWDLDWNDLTFKASPTTIWDSVEFSADALYKRSNIDSSALAGLQEDSRNLEIWFRLTNSDPAVGPNFEHPERDTVSLDYFPDHAPVPVVTSSNPFASLETLTVASTPWAEEVQYTPAGSPTLTFMATVDRYPMEAAGADGMSVQLPAAILHMRVADLQESGDEAKRGDVVVAGGQTYYVTGQPMYLSSTGIVCNLSKRAPVN